MAEKERPLYTLYKGLKANNFDVPDNYDSFERTLTEAGNGGANSRHTLYNSLKEQNFDVPDTYERFYSNLFTPVNKNTSRALGGSVPMSAADKARFSAGAAAISAQAGQAMRRAKNTQRAAKLKQQQEKQRNDFGRVDLGTNKTPYGTDNAVKDNFGFDSNTGKVGTYITSSGEEIDNEFEAGQQQQAEDKFNDAYNAAVASGDIPSAFDVVDKNGNYELYENVGKNGTHITEQGKQNQLDAKINYAKERLADIKARIAEIDSKNGNPLLSYQASIGGDSGVSDERRQLGLAKTQVEEELRSLDAVRKQPDRNFLQNGWQGFSDTALNAKTWDFGLNDFALMAQMERIKTKVDNHVPLTNEEKRLAQSKIGADAAAALADKEMGNAYRWSSIAGQSVPFMLDFYLTGGFGGLTHAAGKAAVKYAAKKGMGAFGKNVLKYTGVTAANIVGSYAMAGTEQAFKTGADIMNRHMGTLYQDEEGNYKFGTFDDNGNLIHDGGDGFGTALYKGLTAAMLENYTEKVFRHTHFKRATSKAFANHFPKFASFLATKGAPKWMKRLGIDGLGEEIMEEEINIPLNSLLVGDNKLSDLGDLQQQGDIIFGIGLSVGAMYAINSVPRGAFKIYNTKQYHKFKNAMDNVDSRLQNMMGDRWDAWKDKIDSTPNEKMGALTKEVLQQKQSGSLNEEEINTIGDYIKNLAKVRGYNLAKTTEVEAKEQTGEETTPEEEQQQEQEQAYAEGQNAEGEEQHEIQMQTAEAEGVLASMLGVSEEQLESVDLDSMLGENDDLDLAIYDYQNSQARYQGVMDNAQSKVDAAEQNAIAEVRRRTDASRGTVRNATIKSASNDLNGGEDYGVFIVSGNIAQNEDGSINTADSDQMILYFDPLTGKIEHGDASRFASLGEEVDAELATQQAVELAKQDAIAGVSRDIDGKIGEGSRFVVTDKQGQQHVYEVLADNGDGTASISIDGNVMENVFPSFDELQKMKDDSDKQRIANTVATKQAEREKQQAAEEQKKQEVEEKVNTIDFSQLIDPKGTITTATIEGEEDKLGFVVGYTPSGKLRIAYLNEDGTVEKRKGLLSPDKVMQGEPMSVEEYKTLMGEQLASLSTNSEVVDESATKEVEGSGLVDETPIEENEPEPVGTGVFGNIYNQFKGKVQDAFNFLMKHKSGDLLGVFHRDDVGDIDLVWGDRAKNQGIDHIIDKHIERHNDFSSIDEAMVVIDDVINNGTINEKKSKWDKVVLEKDGYSVVIRKNIRDDKGNVINESKNWVVTAFESEHKQGEKKASSDVTLAAPNINEGSRAVAPDEASDGKDNKKLSNDNEEKQTLTFADGSPVPMLEDGNPDFAHMTAEQAAELYDSQFGDDAEQILSNSVADAKKALDKAKGKPIKGKTFLEQKASKDANDKAVADAQAAYDNAKAVSNAYQELLIDRSLNTVEGRQNLLGKAKRKYDRLKNTPDYKDNKAKQQSLWDDTVGKVLHRLYDSTSVDVFDPEPRTVEEYVSSNLAPFSLNYEGSKTAKGVKQETGLERKDFAKNHVLAAEGKGQTVDAFVHKLWQNRPPQLDNATDQDIRNAVIDLITSNMNAYDMRHVIENNRIAEAEKEIEDEQTAAENAAYQEEQRKKDEEEEKKKADEEAASSSVATNEVSSPSNTPVETKPRRTGWKRLQELMAMSPEEREAELKKGNQEVEEEERAKVMRKFEEEKKAFSNQSSNEYASVLQESNTPEEAASKFRTMAAERRAVAADWAGRKYKKNNTVLDSHDIYGEEKQTTVNAANERRRHAAINNAIRAAEEYDDMADTILKRSGLPIDTVPVDKSAPADREAQQNEQQPEEQAEIAKYNKLAGIEEDWNEKISDYIAEKYPHHDGVRARTEEEQAEYDAETEAMKNDATLREMRRQANKDFEDAENDEEQQPEQQLPEEDADNMPFGEQLNESDLPFSPNEENKVVGSEERKEMVDKNKVTIDHVSEAFIPEKLQRGISRIAKMMPKVNGKPLTVQYLYSADADGWFDRDTNTLYLALDSSKALQMVFGHEMSHAIKNMNTSSYDELKGLVKEFLGNDFDKAVDATEQFYNAHGVTYNNREDYEEEVVADGIGAIINDLNLTKGIALRMSHPLLAAFHNILMKIRLAFRLSDDGTYEQLTHAVKVIEKAYVDTMKMDAANVENDTGEQGTAFSIRQKPAPEKTIKCYKLMRLGEDGKLYPLFIDAKAPTELNTWYDGDSPNLEQLKGLPSGVHLIDNETGKVTSFEDWYNEHTDLYKKGNGNVSKMGKLPSKEAINWATLHNARFMYIEDTKRGQNRFGGEARKYWNLGINGSGTVSTFSMRPGWHAGSLPTMRQIGKGKDKNLRDDNFVWVEGEISADIDYNEEAQKNPDKDIPNRIPEDGYYLKATNANKSASQADRVGWYVAGAFKANRIMGDAEARKVIDDWNANHPDLSVEYDYERESGMTFNADTMRLEDKDGNPSPKFSLKVYHGSGADFDEFDFDHMGEGAGSQAFGWGGYVTSSKKIGKSYAQSGMQTRTVLVKNNGKWLEFSEGDPMFRVVDEAMYLIKSEGLRGARNFANRWKVDADTEDVRQQWAKVADLLNNHTKADFKSRYPSYLYEVEIPEDNGKNYLDWYKKVGQRVITKVAKAIDADETIKNRLVSWTNNLPEYWDSSTRLNFALENFASTVKKRTGQDLYDILHSILGSDKAASKFLSSLGFTGIKYPAGTIQGGAKEGDMNYVIFKPEDMKIASHTKFSIRTYHGSQASFDHFDHSFMGSGEGAQAYGWGTYVSEVEGIARAYAKQNARKHSNGKGSDLHAKLSDAEFKRSLLDSRYNHVVNDIDFQTKNREKKQAILEEELKDRTRLTETYGESSDIVAETDKIISKLQKILARAENTLVELADRKKKLEQDLANSDKVLADLKAKLTETGEFPWRNLYTVEIPDDTGDNYIGWDGKVSEKAAANIAKGLVAKDMDAAIDMLDMYGNFIVKADIDKLHKGKDIINKEKMAERLGRAIAGYRGGAVYDDLAEILGGQKAASQFLNGNGFDGVKVIAQRNSGGNKQGSMNYVIFDENKAQIVNHEKFSLRDSNDNDFSSRLKSAISDTDVNPSEAQKKSGNYKKGHIKFGGYDFTIENPKGSERKGVDENGKEWSVKMHDTYGYIRGKIGKDGDHLDMFINDSTDLDKWDGNVYVVDQVNEDGSFDEHKVMYGYNSKADAKKAYLANYTKGWKGLGNITGVDKGTFDKWIQSSDRKIKPFAEYSMIRKTDSDIRFSLAGLSGAATADKAEGVITRLQNFNIALQMEKEDKNAKAIKMATGWEKGADGKWRYEIPDFHFNMEEWENKNAQIRDNMDKNDYRNLMRYGKDFYEDLSPIKKRNFDELRKRTGYKLEQELTLGDVLTGKGADNLFKFYPWLRNVKFEFDILKNYVGGVYDDGGKKITVNSVYRYMPNKATSILLHEVQHAIQSHEGFANGGNPRMFTDTIEYVMSDLNQAVGGKLYDAGGVDNNPDSVFKALNQKTAYGTLLRDNDSNLQHVAEKYGYDNIFDLVEDIPNIKSAFQKYKSLAGEVEARNVQSRMGMSDEERRNSLAEETEDTPRDEQSIFFSLKDSDKTMFGMHNISVDKLRKAIKQGGFAAPSMGVVDSKNGVYSDYGEITLIPKAEKLDKRKGKNAGTFTADAWTPTYPRVVMQQTKGGKDKLNADTLVNDNIPEEIGKNLLNRWENYINNGSSRPSEFAWQYMFENGMNPKVTYFKGAYPKSISNKVMEITDNGEKRKNELTKEENGELIKLYNSYLEKKGEGLDDNAVKEIISYLEEWKDNEKVGLFAQNIQRKIDYFKEFGGDINKAQDWAWKEVVPAAKSDGKVNHAMTLYNATLKADSDKKMQADLQKWFDGKLKEYGVEEYLYNGETASGKPKYVPNTVENAVKIMKKQGLAGGYNDFLPGVGAFIAKYAPNANTLAAMKKSKDKLIPFGDERHKEARDMILDEYNDLAKSLTIKPTDAFDDSGTYRMQELADVKPKDLKKYIADNWNKEVSDGWVERYNELVDTIKNDYPVYYFETKFMRPVSLDEFEKAIVPKDTPKDVVDALKKANIDVRTYDGKEDREKVTMDAINDSNDIKFSLRYSDYEKALTDWKKRNGLPKDAKQPEMPQQQPNESKFDYMKRVNRYLGEKALWKTAPTYEGHLLYSDTAVGYLNSELQRGSVLARIAMQDSMLAVRKAQEGIMKELGLDKIGVGEDAYTAENRSHGKGKNEFEEYNQVYLQPLRKAYHAMKKLLGDSYDNVKVYMMSKHGLERNAFIAFREALKKDFTTKEKGKKDVFDATGMQKAYNDYKADINRIKNDADYAAGKIDYATYRQNDDAIRTQYAPSYPEYRYDDEGNVRDYAGLSSLYNEADDFEIAAAANVRDVEDAHGAEATALWDATNASTKKILKDSYQAGMMSKSVYDYVRGMYNNYIPLRGWDGTSADQVWDYVGGGRGAFNQAMKKAEGRKSIADDPIAYIENMAESGILLNNKNWVKQHLLLLAENHPTSMLSVSKAWYVKSRDAQGNEIWMISSPNIPADMTDSEKISQAIEQFDNDMRALEAMGEATQKRGHLDIVYPQTKGEEREHEVRVLRDGEEYVIYVNGDPQLAQAMNNVRAQRVRESQTGILDRSMAWLGRKMAAVYTSLSPLFIPANFTRDLTMTLASTAVREDGRYNYLLRKNFLKHWNTMPLVIKYQNGKLRQKVEDGSATESEKMFYDFMMNGGETGFVSSMEVEDFKKKIQNELKDMDRWKANPKRAVNAIMDSIELLNRAIEDSNRFLVYMTSRQYGRPIEEAINNAKDVTLNFNRKGTGEYGWQMVRNLYLFVNPAVQSLQTLGALAKEHPYKFTAVTSLWVASGVLVPVVNSLLLSMFGSDDDKDKYWSFSKWDRRNNFIMWIPYTKYFVKIPLAQEYRGFYAVGDMIASKLMGGEKAEESWSEYAEDIAGQVVDMLPLDPTGYDGNIVVSLMPNAIRPILELAFNVDFTGKPLFKDTEYNKYDPNFTKAYVGTPDWLVRISKLVNSINNPYPDVQQNAIDRFGNPRFNLNNPAVVDHVLSSYLGGAYTFGSQAVGVLTKALNADSEIKVADIPLLSRFVANPDDRPVTKKQGDAFWTMKEQQDRTANTLSKLKKEAKVSGDYSTLEDFYKSDQYSKFKENAPRIKQYEEDKKKEKAENEGEEYKPHKVSGSDIYKKHASSTDDFEDMKMDLLWKKVGSYKTVYDGLVSVGNSQSESYYGNHAAAINAADEAYNLRSDINGLKKGMITDDGKDGFNADDMKQIRELRKQAISILENAAKTLPKPEKK